MVIQNFQPCTCAGTGYHQHYTSQNQKSIQRYPLPGRGTLNYAIHLGRDSQRMVEELTVIYAVIARQCIDLVLVLAQLPLREQYYLDQIQIQFLELDLALVLAQLPLREQYKVDQIQIQFLELDLALAFSLDLVIAQLRQYVVFRLDIVLALQY